MDEKTINKIAWWIPIRKWRDNFRNKNGVTILEIISIQWKL